MGIGSGLQELGRFIDDCERRAGPVDGVELAELTGGSERLTAGLELTLSVGHTGASPSLRDPRVGADGTVRFALDSTTELLPAADYDVALEPTGASFEGDGDVVVAVTATVLTTTDGDDAPSRAESVRGRAADEAALDGLAGGEADAGADAVAATDGGGSSPTASRDVPPFKDPDLLADVYDSCDTFAEMADALEMDVTAETVRRYMIDYDIHEPNTYQTGDAAAATADEGRVVLSDGIGLPDDVTAEDLVETVERSNTIYEVKQDIDVDREDALEMLQELNLLDLVMGRLATEGERDITREDIVDRLREASAVQ